jgi:3-methyl-2-oxobutanoate hydroxymethyltransferase
VVFGHDTTVPTTVDELIPLTRGVVRAAKRALVVADLPFGSYESGPDDALHTAVRFMKETGAHAVKLEGGERSVAQIERIVQAGIPVMGHIGYTPQSEHGLGGHVVQGRGNGASQLLADAKAVEAAGAFAVVIEMVPEDIAKTVSDALRIPTIGIGAGRHTDGQILVWTDMLGVNTGRVPRFVKQFANLGQAMVEGVARYRDDVRNGSFPAEEHVFED